MSVQERNVFYLDMRFHPQWDIDLILLHENDFPFKKYLSILIENYLEGKPTPKIIDWHRYVDLDGCSETKKKKEKVERIRISFNLDKYSPKFKEYFINGIESRKRSAFCKALLRNAINYYGKSPCRINMKEYCITFSKLYDLDLVSLANKYNIAKMMYDALENLAQSYTMGPENVEPIYFYLDDYYSDTTNEIKSFSVTLKLISNSAVASVLSQCKIDVSQFCKSVLRSRIIAQNLSSYLNKGFENYDKRVYDGVTLTDYNNVHMFSEYAIPSDSSVSSIYMEFKEDKSAYIIDEPISQNTEPVFSSPAYTGKQMIRKTDDIEKADSEILNVGTETFDKTMSDDENEEFKESETNNEIEKLEESEVDDNGFYNKISDVPDEEMDMRGIMIGEPVEDEEEANALLDLIIGAD